AFSPTAAGARSSTLLIADNAPGSPQQAIALTGTGFIVDEPTVTQTVVDGGDAVRMLQNPDGGWYFRVGDTTCGMGAGVSCAHTIGATALGLLAGYDRASTEPLKTNLLTAAIAAGNALVAQFNAAPGSIPYS